MDSLSHYSFNSVHWNNPIHIEFEWNLILIVKLLFFLAKMGKKKFFGAEFYEINNGTVVYWSRAKIWKLLYNMKKNQNRFKPGWKIWNWMQITHKIWKIWWLTQSRNCDIFSCMKRSKFQIYVYITIFENVTNSEPS